MQSNRKLYGKANAFPFVNVTIGDNLVAEDGAMIHVTCAATGSPAPKITWLRRGLSQFLSFISCSHDSLKFFLSISLCVTSFGSQKVFSR